jgi:hypothetical protein
MATISLIEDSLLVSVLFSRLMDGMGEAEREGILGRDPFRKSPVFEEDRTRENVATILAESLSDDLLALYADLFEEPWTHPVGDLTGGDWEEGRVRLFISHHSSTKAFVAEVAQALELYAIHGFVAHEDIQPLRHWEAEIERALQQCHACSAFLSQDFHGSLWTDQEVGFCFARDIPIVPVRMGMDPYGFLGNFQALTVGTMTAPRLAFEIFNLLRGDPRLNDLLDWALLLNFINSQSWQEAAERWRLVKVSVRNWTAERRYLLEVSPARNSQIAGAHYGDLPNVIRRLLRDLPDLTDA